jgi:hypothetical protein
LRSLQGGLVDITADEEEGRRRRRRRIRGRKNKGRRMSRRSKSN